VDDPKVLTKPWTSAVNHYTIGTTPLSEYYCNNNQDIDQLNPSGIKYISPAGLDGLWCGRWVAFPACGNCLGVPDANIGHSQRFQPFLRSSNSLDRNSSGCLDLKSRRWRR